MPEDTPPSLARLLREALPEAVAGDASVARQLEAVAELERAHMALAGRVAAERAFLERAPREGLLYPADALKLAELGAGDPRALDELYARLRRERPYLFAATATSPANEKLAVNLPRDLERGRVPLARDMLALRDAVLRRRKR